MGKVMVVYEEGMPESYHLLIDRIKEYFEQGGYATTIFYIEGVMEPEEYWEKFADLTWDYICTLDMAGFQISTVLGGPRYNIMPAKQIHIVINEDAFALYQDMNFALNLYLFVPETMRKYHLEELFIPNLAYYRPFELTEGSAKDGEKLIQILETVRKECETICG